MSNLEMSQKRKKDCRHKEKSIALIRTNQCSNSKQ
jgi:hypothetical protein